MIRALHVQNFRCLRDVRVELDPLTVLVGPNGSGKSTLLDALVTLARCTRSPLHGQQGEFSFGRPGWQGSAAYEQVVFAQDPLMDIHFDEHYGGAWQPRSACAPPDPAPGGQRAAAPAGSAGPS